MTKDIPKTSDDIKRTRPEAVKTIELLESMGFEYFKGAHLVAPEYMLKIDGSDRYWSYFPGISHGLYLSVSIPLVDTGYKIEKVALVHMQPYLGEEKYPISWDTPLPNIQTVEQIKTVVADLFYAMGKDTPLIEGIYRTDL